MHRNSRVREIMHFESSKLYRFLKHFCQIESRLQSQMTVNQSRGDFFISFFWFKIRPRLFQEFSTKTTGRARFFQKWQAKMRQGGQILPPGLCRVKILSCYKILDKMNSQKRLKDENQLLDKIGFYQVSKEFMKENKILQWV